MKKYHVNNLGEKRICTANGKCRFADNALEKGNSFNKNNDFDYSDCAPLSNFVDLKLLNRMIEKGYITYNKHPDDDSLKVMCYSRAAQYDGKWNDATKHARGIIVKSENKDFSDAVVVEKPWSKFFTLEQMDSSSGKAWSLSDDADGPQNLDLTVEDIDFDAPAEITDKMDGSLGILYTAPDGKLAFSTKASFKSDQAEFYTSMIRNNSEMYKHIEKLKRENPDVSFMFELVGKSNPIVLDYEKDDVVLIGAINKKTGYYYSVDDFDYDLTKVERLEAKTLKEALKMPDRKGQEGFVAKIDNGENGQHLVKVKQKDYLFLSKIMKNIGLSSSKDILRRSDATVNDFLKIAETGNVRDLPEVDKSLKHIESYSDVANVHSAIERQKSYLESGILPVSKKALKVWKEFKSTPEENFKGSKNQVMKKVAESTSKRDSFERALLFSFYNSKLSGKDPLEMKASVLTSHSIKNLKVDGV